MGQTRYLGVIIDKQLKWRKHLEHIERGLAPRISLLWYLARSATEPNSKTMINIYKSLISSIIVYGSPIILTVDQMVWKTLQVLQNKTLRAALELPVFTSVEYIHKVSNIHKTKDYALELLHKAIQKATTNNDIVLQDHLNSIFERI